MSDFLKQILIEEGISQAELSRACGVSLTTINKICTRGLKGTGVSPTTKGKITKGLNKLSDQKYKIQDIRFE